MLRDVLQWKSAEVADAIGTTTIAVNSLLQRARSQLDTVQPSRDERLAAPESPEAQDLLARYIAAFESYDIDRLVELFTAEAVWEMPRTPAGTRDRRTSSRSFTSSVPPNIRATCACCRWSPTASPPPPCTCGRVTGTSLFSCTCWT